MDFWGFFIVGGFGLVALAQVIGAIIAFGYNPLKGILALFIPGYLFVVLKQSGYYGKVVGLWCVGALALVAGTIALS